MTQSHKQPAADDFALMCSGVKKASLRYLFLMYCHYYGVNVLELGNSMRRLTSSLVGLRILQTFLQRGSSISPWSIKYTHPTTNTQASGGLPYPRSSSRSLAWLWLYWICSIAYFMFSTILEIFLFSPWSNPDKSMFPICCTWGLGLDLGLYLSSSRLLALWPSPYFGDRSRELDWIVCF